MQLDLDDDDDDLDGVGATGAIIPPPLAPGAKFNITSTMIQLLHISRDCLVVWQEMIQICT